MEHCACCTVTGHDHWSEQYIRKVLISYRYAAHDTALHTYAPSVLRTRTANANKPYR